ncbi:MAG: hypothetical protein PHF21_04815 [Bacilli bacterium]|nr:hypothetical protein [Bacilli bacterium]
MKKTLLIIALTLGLIYSVGGIYFYFFEKNDKEKTENISEIKAFGYALKSNATDLMKKEFEILKENLESSAIDEEEYVTSVAKLFIIDVYTMSNKMNKYDVGGLNYVMPLGVENLKLNLTNTLYKYLENNIDGKRTQILPEVISITASDIEKTEMKIKNNIYNGYKIHLDWDYKKDLEYEKEAEVILIKDKEKYYIAEKK